MRKWTIIACLCGASLCGLAGDEARAADADLIAVPRYDVVRSRTLDWLATKGVTDEAVLAEIARLWGPSEASLPASELFDRVIDTFRRVDPRAAALVEAGRPGTLALRAPDASLLDEADLSEFYRSNLAQYLGRALVQSKMFDEALVVFERVDLTQSIDPPAYLFHLAVAQQQLLMKEEGLATLNKLLHRAEAVPQRYSMLGGLMEYELQALKPESLGEVAARMKDVERRLSLARGGPTTQKKEEEIIALLDSIIEKIEQGNSSGSGEGNAGNTNQPGDGAKESVIKGTTAPGDTDAKNLKKQAGWGTLPDAEIAQAKNILKRDYPEHYRRAVEQYFRRQAEREQQK